MVKCIKQELKYTEIYTGKMYQAKLMYAYIYIGMV